MSYKYQKLTSPFQANYQSNTVFEYNGISSFNDKTAEFLQKAQTFTTGTKKPKNSEIYQQNSNILDYDTSKQDPYITNYFIIYFQRYFYEIKCNQRKDKNYKRQINRAKQFSGLFNNEENKINELILLIGENIKQIEAGITEIEHGHADECIKQSKAGHQAYKSIIEIMKFTLLKIMDEYKNTTAKRMEDITHNQQKPLFGGTSMIERRPNARNQKAQFLVKNNSNDDIEGGSGGQSYKQLDYKQKEQAQVSEAMKKLNGQLQSVYEMFKKIGSMVQFHESMIESIAENTDQAQMNVDKGKKHITNAYRDATSSRGLIIKIFLIMIIFAFVYIVFLL